MLSAILDGSVSLLDAAATQGLNVLTPVVASCSLSASSPPSHTIPLTVGLGYGLASPSTPTSKSFYYSFISTPTIDILLPSLIVRMLRYRIKDATLVPVDKTLTMVSLFRFIP